MSEMNRQAAPLLKIEGGSFAYKGGPQILKDINIEIPKGASKKVDEFALKLKEQIGLEEVEKLIKKNFKNYQYLL